MSVVTGVTLICSVIDGHDEDESGNDVPTPLIARLNDWLSQQKFGPLRAVQEGAGGNKHPQCCIYAAGYNYFGSCVNEFIGMVLQADWICPQNVVLVMQPEEGETRVYRVG